MSQAIYIKDMMESSRLKVFNVGKNIPIESQTRCPSCDLSLTTLCLLVNKNRDQKIKYGLCTTCGYMGYIDRPEQSWMIEYYNNVWDKDVPVSEAEILNRTILPGKGIKPSGYLAASLIDKINTDKNKTVCEVGTGYGEVLRYFQDRGFKNLVGVENSKHRANLVHKVFGFDVIHGEFGSSKVQEQLLQHQPIGLVFSHHVLEHVYNPQKVLESISALQGLGDHLILALPNALGEHINNGPLFLPHLHSFTKESLEILLNKNGYQIVINSSPENFNTIFAAQKVQNPQPRLKPEGDYLGAALARLRKGLAIDQIKINKLYWLYWGWGQDQDQAKLLSESSGGLFPKVSWYLAKKIAFIKAGLFKRFASGCTMLVANGESQGNVLEIQFDKNIKVFVK